MPTVEVHIPPRSVYVGVVRLAIASLARAAGLDEEAVDDLKIAISEACATAVLGVAEASSAEPISITFTDSGDRLELTVADRGPGPAGAEMPEDTEGFDTRSTMSAALLASLVDDCSIAERDGGGTVTSFSVATA